MDWIPEFVKLEGDDCFRNYYDESMNEVVFERCWNCGSTLCRVVLQKIIEKEGKKEYWVGMEYSIICTKCGSHISGLTDVFTMGEHKRAVEELKEKIDKEFEPELKFKKEKKEET